MVTGTIHLTMTSYGSCSSWWMQIYSMRSSQPCLSVRFMRTVWQWQSILQRSRYRYINDTSFLREKASAFLTAITNQHFWTLMAGPRFLPNNSYRFPRHSIWNIFQRFCRFCGNQICLFRKYCFERNEFKLQFSKSLYNRKIDRVKVNRKYIFSHIYHRELKFFAQSFVLEKIKFEYSSSISLYAFHIQRSISFLLESQYSISCVYLDTYNPNKHERICF